jgi:hypothetical protein
VIRVFGLLDLEGMYHINVKAQFRPNFDVRSTCVSPQLEANTRIPVRRNAVSVGVEPPPCLFIAGLACS